MMRSLYELTRTVREGAEDAARTVGLPVRPKPGATPRATVWQEGAMRLERIVPNHDVPRAGKTPVLLVPSLINRWYVLDLYEGGSLVKIQPKKRSRIGTGSASQSEMARALIVLLIRSVEVWRVCAADSARRSRSRRRGNRSTAARMAARSHLAGWIRTTARP